MTLHSCRREPSLLDAVANGQELLVTRSGKPYVRIVPAKRAQSFVGAGKHLGVRRPISSASIPASAWKGMM